VNPFRISSIGSGNISDTSRWHLKGIVTAIAKLVAIAEKLLGRPCRKQ